MLKRLTNDRPKLSGILAEQEIDYELYFATEVLKMRSLHYGYWDDPPEAPRFDLDELRLAQARYTKHLMEIIPLGVDRVLDVGAGIGDNARALARRGHRVHAISPDRNHRRYFRSMDLSQVTFEQARFEEFDSYARYDLILFGESHNYIDHRIALEQCRRFLAPGGHIIVTGMFRAPDRGPLPRGFEIGDHPYFDTARQLGFEADEVIDVTDNVLPTMAMIHTLYRDHLEPLLELGVSYLRSTAPLRALLLETIGAPQWEKLARVRDYYAERIDPDYFRTHVRYGFVRLVDANPSLRSATSR